MWDVDYERIYFMLVMMFGKGFTLLYKLAMGFVSIFHWDLSCSIVTIVLGPAVVVVISLETFGRLVFRSEFVPVIVWEF